MMATESLITESFRTLSTIGLGNFGFGLTGLGVESNRCGRRLVSCTGDGIGLMESVSCAMVTEAKNSIISNRKKERPDFMPCKSIFFRWIIFVDTRGYIG
jgi:hypothetical protein